jgi:hypothetical protein
MMSDSFRKFHEFPRAQRAGQRDRDFGDRSGTNEKSHCEYKGCAEVLRYEVIVLKRFFMLPRIFREMWDIEGT